MVETITDYWQFNKNWTGLSHSTLLIFHFPPQLKPGQRPSQGDKPLCAQLWHNTIPRTEEYDVSTVCSRPGTVITAAPPPAGTSTTHSLTISCSRVLSQLSSWRHGAFHDQVTEVTNSSPLSHWRWSIQHSTNRLDHQHHCQCSTPLPSPGPPSVMWPAQQKLTQWITLLLLHLLLFVESSPWMDVHHGDTVHHCYTQSSHLVGHLIISPPWAHHDNIILLNSFPLFIFIIANPGH